MHSISRNFIIIYPDNANPEMLAGVLSKNDFLPIRIMTYSDWIQEPKVPDFDVLCLRESGCWVFAQSEVQKSTIRAEIQSSLLRETS